MRSTRVGTEKLAVKHKRQPGEWMPIGRMTMRERPYNIANAKSARHVAIVLHVRAVVEINVLKRQALRIDDRHGERKKQHYGSRFRPAA